MQAGQGCRRVGVCERSTERRTIKVQIVPNLRWLRGSFFSVCCPLLAASCLFSPNHRSAPASMVGGSFAPTCSAAFRSMKSSKYHAPHRFAWPRPVGYTFGMKTAISIPDKIFHDAERLSRRLNKSRSQIYTEAVTEYIARHDPEAVTEAMNRVCEAMGDYPDPAIAVAARRTLEDVEW